MKIKLSDNKLLLEGRALSVLWEIVDWSGSEPTSSTLLIFPRMQVHGYLKTTTPHVNTRNTATGKIDGWDPPCGVIEVETPKMKNFWVGMSKCLMPDGFQEERAAIVQTPDGLWVTRGIFICEKLDLKNESNNQVQTRREIY